jgi:hypothetical protein
MQPLYSVHPAIKQTLQILYLQETILINNKTGMHGLHPGCTIEKGFKI